MDAHSAFFWRDAASSQTCSKQGPSLQADARGDSAGQEKSACGTRMLLLLLLGVLNARGEAACSPAGFAELLALGREELRALR